MHYKLNPFAPVACIFVLFYVSLLQPRLCLSYVVTSTNTLPLNRRIEWLKQLTNEVVSGTPPGKLSPLQVSTSHELMYAWSHTRITEPKHLVSNPNQKTSSSVNFKECALHVEALLKRLIEERVAGNEKVDLYTGDYNCLLEGWARSGLGEESAQRTENILEAMQTQGPIPDLSSFKACLMAWRQSGVPFAAIRAQRVLEWMIRLYHSKENVSALPDSDCFDIVLQLWSRSGHDSAPKQTERLLGIMERLHRSTGHDKLKPKITSFNAILAAWSKAKNVESSVAMDRVTKILYFMENLAKSNERVSPDSASFNMVMNTYAKSHDAANAAIQGDSFLRHVTDMYKKQLQEYESNTREFMPSKPDAILFSTAIGLWSKSGMSKSYRKAHSILDRQLKLARDYNFAAPDVFGWTSVLSSCAAEAGHAEERAKAFQVAASTYKLMQKHEATANHVTYGTMLKACARLHPIKSQLREKWVRRTFADAIKAGCVGEMVVSKLREAATPEVYNELMQGFSKRQLPRSWTINVNEQSEYRSSNKMRAFKRAEV
jgi:hypothetical protein